MNLADAILDALPSDGAWAVGRVTAVSTRLTVTVRGGAKDVGRLASYSSPAVGDVVLIACVPQSWCALGKIV